MLTLKDIVLAWRIRRLVDKRNAAFFEGDYDKAMYYGKLVDKHSANILKLSQK